MICFRPMPWPDNRCVRQLQTHSSGPASCRLIRQRWSAWTYSPGGEGVSEQQIFRTRLADDVELTRGYALI